MIVFNQKVREAEAGTKGKLGGIVKLGVLVEVDGRFVTVSNKMLEKITVCRPQETRVAENDRLHLKANRNLASGGRVTNGELVTVKSVGGDGRIKLTDGRVLDASYREFLPGYAVTSYGSQGKTVDYVLFSDSTVKAADQFGAMVCRSRAGGGASAFSRGQRATSRKHPPLRPSAIGDGIRGWSDFIRARSAMEKTARLFTTFRSSSRRQHLPSETGSSSSSSTQTQL